MCVSSVRMSTSELLPCAECGARPKRREDRFCAFCGHELPRPVAAVPTPSVAREARFENARRSAAYAHALQHEPSTRHLALGGTFGTVFLVFFAVVALGIGGVGCSMGALSGSGFGLTFSGIFTLVPIGMAAFAIFAAVKSAQRTSAIVNSPTDRRLAVVRDERTAVSGGGRNSSASTQYYVTLEYEEGGRKEHPVDPGLASRVAPGDLGVACERGGYLVDFVPLDA